MSNSFFFHKRILNIKIPSAFGNVFTIPPMFDICFALATFLFLFQLTNLLFRKIVFCNIHIRFQNASLRRILPCS